MTPERARAIWQTRTPFGGVSCSAQEDAYVRKIWLRMPGCMSWADALLAIANDVVPAARPPLSGSVTFWHCGVFLEEVALYEGEHPEDPAILARAQRNLKMLQPANPTFLGWLQVAARRYRPLGH